MEEAISKAGKAASEYAVEKINSTPEKAINKGLPPEAIRSIKDMLEKGVKSAQVEVTCGINILVDQASISAYNS